MFLGRGRRGTDWKGVATKSRAKERVDWTEANEAAMENGSRTARGDPRLARTPSREQQSILFSLIFYEAEVCTCYLRQWSLYRWRVVYPSWGTTPAIIRGVVS